MVVEGKRPEIPGVCPQDLVDLMQRGWEQDPAKRPASFENEVGELDRMLEAAGGDPRQKQEVEDEGRRNVFSPGHGVLLDRLTSPPTNYSNPIGGASVVSEG